MYAVIDLETTGLKNSSEIAQLAIWILDEELNPVEFSNDYFSISEEMPPEAMRVNHLDKNTLYRLSGGKSFNDRSAEIVEKLRDKILVAHNANFEKRILGYHLNHILDDNTWICTMLRYTPALALKDRAGNNGYKQCNLSELVSFTLKERNMDVNQLCEMYKRVTGKEAQFHDALYDTYCTALAFNTFG